MKSFYLLLTTFALILSSHNLVAQQSIGGYNVYFGNLHNHSNISDGIGSADQAYNYAKNTSHLDFFSLADHSDGSGNIDADEWITSQIAADTYNEPGVFTSFRGFEWTNYTYGHVTVINSENYCTTEFPTNTFTGLCDWLNSNECIAFFNHPGYSDANRMEFNHFLTTPSSKLVGMELWTMDKDFSLYYYNDGYYSNDGNKGYYDEALKRQWKIGALGSEDNHFGNWGSLVEYRMAILANANTREDLYSALMARRFYSTLDKNLALSFKIDSNQMGSTILPGNYSMHIQASDGDGELFTKVELLKNGVVLNTWWPFLATPDITLNLAFSNNDYYYVRVKQADGDEAISSPIWISDGNQFPVVYITNPISGTVFAPPASITVDAFASDPDGTIASVEFYSGSTLLNIVNTSPYTFSKSKVNPGNYTITAKATDNTGAETTSAPITITVGAHEHPPIVSISNPASGTIYTDPASITIDAIASDSAGTIVRVEFYSGNTLLGTDYTSPYSYSRSNVNLGRYLITAKAINNEGAETTSIPVTIVVVSNQPPVVSISSPLSGTIFTAPASVTIDASATDPDGTVAKVDFYNGDTLLGSVNADPYSFTWTDVTEGSYSITAVTTDNTGAETSSTPVTITVVAPNQPPVVSISSPVSGAVFTAPASVTINASASDPDGTVAKVDLYNGATLLGSVNADPYSFTWTDLTEGDYSITAMATDNKGAETISTPVSITVIAPNQPPVVSISSPVSGTIFTAPASVTIDASASDPDGTVAKVDLYNGATLLGSVNADPYSFTWTDVTEGSYSITAVATDNTGAETSSTPVTITVIAPNQPPVVSISNPLSGTLFTAPASVTIDASASDPDGTVAKVDLYNGATLLGSVNADPYSFTWTDLTEGSYSITAVATDNTGAETSSTPVTITVIAPNQPPVVSISSPVSGAVFTAPASVTIDASASDPDGTITKVDFYNGATLLGSVNADPYSFTWTDVTEGSYSITAVATDNTGAETSSTPVTITVIAPNQPPVVSISSPVSSTIFTTPASVTIDASASDPDGTVAKVDLYNGATLLGSVNADPYSFTWTDVTEGSYSITAVATDNTGAETTSNPVTITVVAPNQPPVVSISNPVSGAVFTAPASVTIDVSATDPDGTVAKVDLYNGATLLGSVNADPYSFTWTDITEGSYSITAVATDNTGAETSSTPVTITVIAPNQPPVVSISSPVSGAVFTAPASVTINASASDPDGTVAKVDLYNGATLLGSVNADPYSFTWTDLTEGDYSITAMATDNKGAETISTPVSITVIAPNQPPVVSISSPVSGTIFTAPASVTIDASASDPDGTVAKVDLYNGATLLGSVNADPYSFTWTDVTEGSYSITAVATDNTGAETSSTPVTITVIAPNQPPVVSISNPLSGTLFTAPASVTIDASASDPDGTVAKVDLYNGATLLGSVNADPYSFTWTDLTEGDYSITAVATDNTGAETSSTPVTITVIAPNQPPVVSISSPVSSTIFTTPASVTIDASASDPDGTVAKVDFYNEDTLLGSVNADPYSFTWTDVTEGSYSITAVATDNTGAETSSTPVTITVIAPNQPPVVSISSPLSGTIFTAPASVTIDASASDPDGTVAKVDLYNGATLLGSVNADPYSFTWTDVTEGSYSITAVATDNTGAETSSTPVTITVVAPNQPPVVSISSPLSGTIFTAPASVTIEASASDPDGTIAKVDFYNGDTLLGSVNADPYSFTWTDVTEGSYSITAVATDNTGAETSSTPVTITVIAPNQPPVVSISSPVSGTIFTAPASVTIDASASDPDGTIAKVDLYNGATLLGSVNADPYSFTWTDLTEGNYSITAVATDNTGAETSSTPVTITVIAPNQPPVVSISSPLSGTIFTAPASVTIDASASDPDGTVAKVDLYNGATLLGSVNADPYSFTWTDVTEGSYSITAVATDNTGAETSSTPVTITVVAPNQPPVVSISSPLSGTIFTAPASVTIEASASDPDGTVAKVDFYNGNTFLVSVKESPYSFTRTNIPVGSYSITAHTTDNSGASTVSAPVTIVVVSNQRPVVSITNPLSGSVFDSSAYVTINATASDPDGTITNVDFYNGNTFLVSVKESPYSFTRTNIPVGSYSITAHATDNSGASTVSAPVTLTVTALKSGILKTSEIETSKNEISVKSGNMVCYPVPFNNQLHIEFIPADGENINAIEIFNIDGKCLINQMPYNAKIVLDLSNLMPGIYIVRVRTNLGLYNKSVIKL